MEPPRQIGLILAILGSEASPHPHPPRNRVQWPPKRKYISKVCHHHNQCKCHLYCLFADASQTLHSMSLPLRSTHRAILGAQQMTAMHQTQLQNNVRSLIASKHVAVIVMSRSIAPHRMFVLRYCWRRCFHVCLTVSNRLHRHKTIKSRQSTQCE